MICLWLNLICGFFNIFVCEPTVNHAIGAANLLGAGFLYGVRLADQTQ